MFNIYCLMSFIVNVHFFEYLIVHFILLKNQSIHRISYFFSKVECCYC